jgi:hypothetical protein
VAGELDGREQVVTGECARLLTELAALRDFPVPGDDADGHEVHAAMRNMRARLDRAGEIKIELARYRRQARRTAHRLAAECSEAYDAEMAELARKAMRLEYQGVADRVAMARTVTSPLRRKQLAAERVADLVDEAAEVADSLFFGMRDIRRELLATLEHYLPWAKSMEYT